MKLFRSIIPTFMLLLPAVSLADYHPPVEYGVAVTIDFVLYNTDGTLDVNEVDGGAEITADCDGTPTNPITNDFVDEGAFYSIALTAGEASCARITLTIAATDTNVVVIPTFGNASAQVDDDGAWLTDIPWNASWDAQVESEAADALIADGLDHLVSAAVIGADVTDNSIIAFLVGDDATADWDTYDNTTESREALRLRGDAAWTTGGGTGLTALAADTAQSGSASGIVIAAVEAFADDVLIGNTICIHTGTGAGQCRHISDNALSGDSLVTEPDWVTNPGADSQYEIILGSVNVSVWDGTDITTALETSADIADAVLLELVADHKGTTGSLADVIDDIIVDTVEIGANGLGLTAITDQTDSLTFTVANQVDSNPLSISGDATAANNLELQYDTTGLTGNTFPAAQLALATAQSDLDTLTDALTPISGTADSGSTTTMVDEVRDEADADYWAKGIAIVFTSGTLDGQSACVYDFTVGSPATLTFRPAVTQAVTTHTYILLTHPTCGGVVAP